ncbi:MAG TPA: protein-disulfide reductase DsbD domain-containing protein [Pirellulales bacterium]|nr:protein-disulfide reductase DsbD domain-containing protein [Pirellulales bacterium]
MRNRLLRSLGWGLCAAFVCLPLAARGQDALPKFDIQGLNANVIGDPGGRDKPVTIEAAFYVEPGARTGELAITAKLDKGWHIYSITQSRGGPIVTQIKLAESEQYKLTGDFAASPTPKKHIDQAAWPGLELQEHYERVTWTAPIEIAESVDPTQLEIAGKVYAQACEKGCLPPEDMPFTAKWHKPAEKPAASEPAAAVYSAEGISFRGHLEPKVAVPGGKVKLVLTAEPAEGWHVYELGRPDGEAVSHPTLIVVTDGAGLEVGETLPDVEPKHEGDNPVAQYDEPVSWTTELTVPNSAQPGELKLSGLLAYQVCNASCLRPTAIGFETTLTIDFNSADGVVPVNFTSKTSYSEAADALADDPGELDLSQVKATGVETANQPLWRMMLFGLLGGLILNVMPCVLPVIGLKVLSFIEQGGQSRSRVLMLNIWYSLGLLSVFMVLATLPVAARLLFGQQFSWGQQFAYDGFNITLTSIVFVMTLSFLGVWEIPIPGFVGSGAANDLAEQEGFSGAFVKGALTTVLATPCSGPLLGPALGFAFAQPPLVIYLMFACIGLGMASPYLLIGAFPSLIRRLPKPGAWMDTFKQTMGFVLLATVVYLMTLIRWERFIPTLAFLMGLWAAAWWVGRVPLYAEFSAKARAWAGACAFAALIGLFSYQWLGGVMESRFEMMMNREIAARLSGKDQAAKVAQTEEGHELPWQPFSMANLVEYTREGKTVMVDFTADWCPSCKTLEATVLNTEATREFLAANGVIPMVADMTRNPPDEAELLSALAGPSGAVPVLAIFPAGRANEPIVLAAGFYTRGELLERLKQAGPSKGAVGQKNATAMVGAK